MIFKESYVSWTTEHIEAHLAPSELTAARLEHHRCTAIAFQSYICCEKGLDTTLSDITVNGLYLGVQPIAEIIR